MVTIGSILRALPQVTARHRDWSLTCNANLLNSNQLVIDPVLPNGRCHARCKLDMTDTTMPKKTSRLPDTSGPMVRQYWMELLDWSYANQRVTWREIEPGVSAVIIPMASRKAVDQDLLDAEIRMAVGQVPGMARGIRFELEKAGEFAFMPPADYRGWLGAYGRDIAAGETQVTVFIDLAYLEAALLARLWDHGVIVDFASPLAFFRRGALTDYANIYEAAVAMVVEGRSLADTADLLASQILDRLQLYANVYLQLSTLYVQAEWQIDHDNFVAKIPGSQNSLVLQYWALWTNQKSPAQSANPWHDRIEGFLNQGILPRQDSGFPKSFAA
jgi:hypothetical protein